MPSLIQNNWTLKKLIQNTYTHQYSRSRFVYEKRDKVKVIRIEKVSVYDGLSPGKARTKFVVSTQSTPQYAPYYTRKDRWGKPRKYQIKYKHQYAVIVQLEKLSIDVPFKGRVGALGKWDFSSKGRTKKLKNGLIVEGSNVTRGLNGDFFFRCDYIWKQQGILFGRSYTNAPPLKINPKGIVYAPKHFLAVIETLMNMGKLT